MQTETKIICTIGPASSDEKILVRMAKAGINVVRLNMSHGNHQTQENVIKKVRKINAEKNLNLKILMDLEGYRIRIGKLDQLTRTMALECGQYNIQANSVCPTIVLTKLGKKFWDNPERVEQRESQEARIPLYRFAQPKEVIDTIIYLSSSAADFVTGVSLPLDGGMQISP